MTNDRRKRLLSPRGRTVAVVLSLTVAAAATVFAVTSATTSAGAGPTNPTPVAPTKPTVIPGTYVALGDSYTSGPDVPVQLGPTTTPSAPSACQRSSANYPSLVARALGLQLDDVSCGGATTDDMTESQGPGIPPQFDALRSTTALVTVGIGGTISASRPLPPTVLRTRRGGRPGLGGAVRTTTSRAAWTNWRPRSSRWAPR